MEHEWQEQLILNQNMWRRSGTDYCHDSSSNVSNRTIPYHAYACDCFPGFANGVCTYEVIAAFDAQCHVPVGGNCDVDVDECASNPCQINATCAESTTEASIPFHAYRCYCAAGWANGTCLNNRVGAYGAMCVIHNGGNCDVDIDECASLPCLNGGSCSDSTTNTSIPLNQYTCSCAPGFANGQCFYSFVSNYTIQCTLAYGGRCDIDVNECDSNPCRNGATCFEGVHQYRCDCVTGWIGEHCEMEIDPCSRQEDDCDPSHAVCAHTGPGTHSCTCHYGWNGTGQICQDIDECGS
eukprot:SAG25_NODE_3333_length_1125_cov_1.813840_1_plen_294_part_10